MATEITLILLLALSLTTVCETLLRKREVKVWLHSPRITPWGKFGSKELCPKESFITGMRLKVDHKHLGDNTALNAVQLVCTTMYGDDNEIISSATGRFGVYGQIKYCQTGYATGYQLRSQNGQGNARDDVAAVDFKLICSDFNGTSSYAIDDDNGLLLWGNWTQKQKCPSKTAVCGISTQVEDLGNILKNDDETTLNNVDVACCPLPLKTEPICKLKYRWETMIGCPSETINCEVTLSTGMVENEQLFKFRRFYNKLGHDVKFHAYVLKALKHKAKKYVEEKNESLLKHLVNSTEIVDEKSSFQVKCESILQQLVVTCGFIKLYTYRNRCVPDENDEKGRYLPIHNQGVCLSVKFSEWKRVGLYFRPSDRFATIFWSYNCDFIGGHIAIVRSEIADCGDICFSNIECTHFVWNKYDGGACWLKGFGTIRTSVEKHDNFLCGWIERPDGSE